MGVEINRSGRLVTPGEEIINIRNMADIYVRFQGRLAIAGSLSSHNRVAITTDCYYPESLGLKPQVDDGGTVYMDGEVIVIGDYVTTSTSIKAFQEGRGRKYGDIIREVRLETAQLFASIYRKEVRVELRDEDPIIVRP